MKQSLGNPVVIIGAGVAGLSLALSLQTHGIRCVIYERQAPLTDLTGSLILSPNSLRILDTLGLYDSIKTKGYFFEHFDCGHEGSAVVNSFPLGSQVFYWYKALRINRYVLQGELQNFAASHGILLYDNAIFTHIISETADEVTFQLADGSTHKTPLLIGADGIHSAVRQYIDSGAMPTFSSIVGVGFSVSSAHLQSFKSAFSNPISMTGQQGNVVIARETSKGEDVVIATQQTMSEQAAQLAAMSSKSSLHSQLSHHDANWPSVFQSTFQHMRKDSLFVWPFYNLPRLLRWGSEKSNRVVVIGDAAHVISPATGQGPSQAIEDGYALALMMKGSSNNRLSDAALEFWQNYRQGRVDRIMDLSWKLNNAALPREQMGKLPKAAVWQWGSAEELSWLYDPQIEEVIAAWLSTRQA